MLLPLFISALLAISAYAVDERQEAFIGYKEDSADFEFVLTLDRGLGKIRIQPRRDISPRIVRLIHDLAAKGACSHCKFYRHEPVAAGWGAQRGIWGPPYALLQGTFQDLPEQPPFEGNPVVKKGDVCIIPNSKEFFIATADHDEWGTAHSVWGKVADADSWATIARTPVEPYTTITDKYNITTRWLTEATHIKFTLQIEKAHSR